MQAKFVKIARLAAFLLLAVVTVYGAYKFMTGDWQTVISYWRDHIEIVPMLCGFSLLDVMLEGLAWMWVYHRFGIQAFDGNGIATFVAGRAGLLMPAQLGRLIRPDAMVKLKRAPLATCLKAEAVVFALDAISVFALLAGLFVYRIYPWASVIAAIVIIAVAIFLGNRLAAMLMHTRMNMPAAFWWAWPTIIIVAIDMAGWIAHGIGLHVIVAGMPGDMTLWDSLFVAPGSAVLGVSTGLPGGIGATEGIIGASLRLRSVPIEHLAVAITAFRLITFWIWIPIGWIALAILNRRISRPITVESASHIVEEEALG